MLSEQTKRILVLRDAVNPSFAYAFLGCSILGWLWTLAQYVVTRDLQEPIFIPDTIVRKGSYFVIDSNSYLVLLSITVIISIVTICCFRFGHKKFSTNGSESK